MEDLTQERRAPLLNNEDLDIFDDKHESDNDVLENDMESFSSVIQTNLNNYPLYYYGDSDLMNRLRRIGITKAAQMMGQDLFSAWGILNPAYTEEEFKVPVTLRK